MADHLFQLDLSMIMAMLDKPVTRLVEAPDF